MTRISKKLLSYILGAIACFAVLFGVLFASPEMRTAKAESLATSGWWLEVEGDAMFRLQNGTAYWPGYTNDATPENLMTHTELNGKTLAEINAEKPGAVKVTLQPAGGTIGSFFRVQINKERAGFSVADLGTVVIRAGWSHTDNGAYGNGATYTIDTDLYFAHVQNKNAIESKYWKYIPAANVVDISDSLIMQDQGILSNAPNTRTILFYASGNSYWTADPGTPNEAGGTFLNMMYVNGTSIKEWNDKAHAALEKGEITDITYGSGHGTISGNKGVYAPIFVSNSNPTGDYGSLSQVWIPTGYIPNVSSFKLAKGYANLQGDTLYYVSKDVEYVKSGSSFVKVASSVDISDAFKIIAQDRTADDGTMLYYLHTNNVQYWTQQYSDTVTVINEYEWKGVESADERGGAVQMSYLEFNGTPIYDINASDNGKYGATQEQIAKGGRFAPILGILTTKEVGNAIKIQVPSAYPSGSAGSEHKSLTIKKGFYVLDTATNIKYEVTRDLQWDCENGVWGEHVEKINATVEDARLLFNSPTDAFAGIKIAGSDYASAPGTYPGTVETALSFAQNPNFYTKILVDGVTMKQPGEAFLNVWGNMGYFTFRPGNIHATKLTVLAGCQLPTYDALLLGTNEVYVTTEDVTFVKEGDTWVKEVVQAPEAATFNTSVTGIVTKANRTDGKANESFLIFQLSENDYDGLNTMEMADISSLADSIEINGVPYGLATYGGQKFFNVWGIADSIAFRFNRTEAEDYLEVQEITHITIKAGAKFPAYTTQNGGAETYYVTTQDVTFVHVLPQDIWVVGDYVESTKTETTVTDIVTSYSTGRGYLGVKLEGGDYTANKNSIASTYYPLLSYYISYVDASGTHNAAISAAAINISRYSNSFAINLGGLNADGLAAVKSVTIKAGAQFPTLAYINGGAPAYFVTTEDVTYYQHDTDVWSTEVPEVEPETVNITDNIILGNQGSLGVEGNNTYLIKLDGIYWTANTNLNVTQTNDVGGSEVLKYIKFNGTSLYEINANDDETYGSQNSNVLNGGVYAPIFVSMGVDSGAKVPYSYIQLHVPVGYPNVEATLNENHKSIEILEGFSITENGTKYTVTQDLKWANLNGSWVNGDQTFAADTVEFSNPRRAGDARELYMVDITSTSWDNASDGYNIMWDTTAAHNFLKYIFINGVSVHDINTNTDYSSYVFSTSPQTGHDLSEKYFARPVLVYIEHNVITLWIHEDYMSTLGNEVTITLGAGYAAYAVDGKALAEDVNYDMITTVTINGVDHTIVKGETLSTLGMATLDKPSTATAAYQFKGWYIQGTETVWDANTGYFVEPISVVPQYEEIPLNFMETQVVGLVHQLKTASDNWLLFDLSVHDYPGTQTTMTGGYEELLRIGLLDHVVLKGTIILGSKTVEEATLMDVYNTYPNHREGPYLSTNGGDLIIRVPVGSGINEIIIKENCYFPSYAYLSDTTGTMVDTRYVVLREARYVYDENQNAFVKASVEEVDIQMTDGASVRIKDIADDFSTDHVDKEAYYYTKSGLRFVTNISEESMETLKAALESGKYYNVTFGTLIATTGDLMGGQFTHDWLTKNGVTHLDIDCTAGFYQEDGVWKYAFPENENGYYSFFGSVVKLKDTNYDRWFSGLGYIKLWLDEAGEKVTYIYAPYNSANSRSMAYVANAAIADRSATEMGEYDNKIEEDSYSPYTAAQNKFLSVYSAVMNLGSKIDTKLNNLTIKGGSETVNLGTKLNGPYVTLTYSTNVNVWGKFTYTDGSKTANEDFYLMAGTTKHKQYLDLYRKNGVAYGMNASNITMTSITFTNAELQQTVDGNVKILGFGSENKSIDTNNQEIYLTVAQDNGSEMTVGAHLGLGGALTYLAKSGLYEGINGSYVKVQQNTAGYSDYYGHATSSKPGDGAVNLINNYDAGRQIQQSWYAQVGGSDDASTGANGYTRPMCYTESSAGKYWPYNPVQAGDVMSNPSQIIDYEIKEPSVDSHGNYIGGYIYVKTRAMDWGKGQMEEVKLGDWVISSKPAENAIEGGVTTKSYMENYYRLNKDGTLYVNNSFVDWNGFTDMETCEWASTELPAVYPIQSLNYYVSNINGTWGDALEFTPNLGSWVGSGLYQFKTPATNDVHPDYTMAEEWFAWANGGSGSSLALGMYIPNVDRFTSGRSQASNKQSVSDNKNASSNLLSKKGLMSNMQAITKSYQGAYIGNTSYTAPGISFRMEAYKPIEYTYVISVDTVDNMRATFKAIKDTGKVTNAGEGYQKVGLDAWARADKKWTQY